MKTKIVYVITSSLNDIYWEEGWVSAWSARYHNPEAHIVLVCDKETLGVAENSYRKKSLDLFDEKITVDFDDGIAQKQRSRWIKTNLREYVKGDFLYIDTDTVITNKLDEVDEWNFDIGMVLDGHRKTTFASNIQLYEKAYHQVLADDVPYYNSGVVYARDNEKVRFFYHQWHQNWCELGDILKYTDQTPLMRTTIELGYPITEIPGIYNCQVLFSIKYLHQSKIMHFIHLWQHSYSAISPFMKKTTFQRIKDTQGLDKDFQQMILNCKEEFEETSAPVNEDVIHFLESTIIWSILFPFYQKNRSFFLHADNCLHSICRVLYRIYIRLKSLLS